MILKNLLNIHGKLDWRAQSSTLDVKDLQFDSRKIKKGSVYVAIRGTSGDGHSFIESAIQNGAVALVVEDGSRVPASYRGAVIEVLDSRLSLQVLSQRLYESPGEQMTAIAVTGTNGKTSTTYILEHLINGMGGKCGVIGTINHHLGEKIWPTDLTTPDPVTLQKRLKDFLDLGADSFVIEASSHALAQNRISQGFDVAIFTNLSRDHLDYHPTMEDYFLAKAKLFDKETAKFDKDCFAIINGDDAYGKTLGEKTKKRQVFYFGENDGNDFKFTIIEQNLEGCKVQLLLPNKNEIIFQNPLIGKHNVYNVVGCLASLHALGYDLKTSGGVVASFPGVPGRLQAVKSKQNIYAFVDYAHTPDALEKVLLSLKNLMQGKGQLICVFGCGGDRDKGKRPLMAKVAQKGSDLVIVTSDNPRTEDPQKILDDITAGLVSGKNVITEIDRARAIEIAVGKAKPGDVILVAGKGHENYQILGDKKIDFSDYDQLQGQLAQERK